MEASTVRVKESESGGKRLPASDQSSASVRESESRKRVQLSVCVFVGRNLRAKRAKVELLLLLVQLSE